MGLRAGPLQAASVLCFAWLSVACGGGDQDPTGQQQEHQCEGRGEPIVLGMSKTSASGLVSATLTQATPLPPAQAPNTWTLELLHSTGEPVVDLDPDPGDEDAVARDSEVVGEIYMADHAHRLRKSAVMSDPGVFELPFQITMNGYWEVTVTVQPDESPDDFEDALFGFCVD